MKHIIGIQKSAELASNINTANLLIEVFVKNTQMIFVDKLNYVAVNNMGNDFTVVTFGVDDRYDVDVYDYIEGLYDGFKTIGMMIKYNIKNEAK